MILITQGHPSTKFRVGALAAFMGLLTFAPPAHADEQYFGYTYSAEVLGKGATEAELWAHGTARERRRPFRRAGLSPRTRTWIHQSPDGRRYANFAGHHIRGLSPGFDRTDRDLAFRGLSAEFKYNVLSPYKDGIGLSLLR